MNIIKACFTVICHQIINIMRIFRQEPLSVIHLGSTMLDNDDVALAKHWLKNRNYWNRPDECVEFNQKFAQWNGSKYAYAFMGGRIALSACIYALDLKPDDEVILPGYTCVVVPNAFHHARIKTVYSDIELDTYGLDVNQLQNKITTKTRAIMLHHLYGLVCRDYAAIVELAKQHDLKVIEDCAQAIGAVFRGKKVGNLGDVAFYSCEQSKALNTIQGGLATTNDINIMQKLSTYYKQADYPNADWIDKQLHNVIINYFRYKSPQRWLLGSVFKALYSNKILISTTFNEENGAEPINKNKKMPAPIAALGINQLNKLDRYNNIRRNNAKKWDAWCDEQGYDKPLVVKDSLPVFLRYPVIVEPEKKINPQWARKGLGVELGCWFVSHLHPSSHHVQDCPNAEKAIKQCVNFPCLGVKNDK